MTVCDVEVEIRDHLFCLTSSTTSVSAFRVNSVDNGRLRNRPDVSLHYLEPGWLAPDLL